MDTYRPDGLLDVLQKKTGCTYLSDLHNMRFAEQIKRSVQSIDPAEYDRFVWADAVNYMTGGSAVFPSTEAAVAFLCAYLDDAIRQSTLS